ncbi:MAG: hypothetical protein MZV49_25735 [Rhodopseudomonas palustris]|nr:hypothetical protein [Rhodopseudomonas palustris]
MALFMKGETESAFRNIREAIQLETGLSGGQRQSAENICKRQKWKMNPGYEKDEDQQSMPW